MKGVVFNGITPYLTFTVESQSNDLTYHQPYKVRQSIIRHAFRYFLGRNETLDDSKALMDADRAYLMSNGSFDEVIISLLTSDSFIYRKTNTEE